MQVKLKKINVAQKYFFLWNHEECGQMEKRGPKNEPRGTNSCVCSFFWSLVGQGEKKQAGKGHILIHSPKKFFLCNHRSYEQTASYDQRMVQWEQNCVVGPFFMRLVEAENVDKGKSDFRLWRSQFSELPRMLSYDLAARPLSKG